MILRNISYNAFRHIYRAGFLCMFAVMLFLGGCSRENRNDGTIQDKSDKLGQTDYEGKEAVNHGSDDKINEDADKNNSDGIQDIRKNELDANDIRKNDIKNNDDFDIQPDSENHNINKADKKADENMSGVNGDEMEVFGNQTGNKDAVKAGIHNSISPASPALSIVDTGLFTEKELRGFFTQSAITKDIMERIYGISYKEDCQVPKEELTYLKVLHYGYDENTYIGEIIVNKAIAEDVLDIFEELYEAKYPIEKMVLVDTYKADDNLSMADNNSSSFNYRVIDGTTKLSNHSRGLAIDINPLYNPYVRTRNGELEVLPAEAVPYAEREKDCSYYIKEGDVCYQAFVKRGFSWGGNWKSSKDYQHFDITID